MLPVEPIIFSKEWWEHDNNVLNQWCDSFCSPFIAEQPFLANPEVYRTIGVVMMNAPDGTPIPVGITALKDGHHLFCYHPTYLADSSLPPISDTLPKRPEPYEGGNKSLLSFFDNLIAEGWLGKAQASVMGIAENKIATETETVTDRYRRLLSFGRDCPGAVWMTYIHPEPELEKAYQGTIEAALSSRSNISGTQPKLLAVQDGNELRPANYWETSTHIVKLPNPKFPGLLEYEYMSMIATQALLPEDHCAKATLTPLALRNHSTREVLAIKRFDRTSAGGRLHFEEMNQLLGKSCKDRDVGLYREMADEVRKKIGPEGVKQLYKRLVCQFLLSNADNHFKNFALFHDADGWQLTPDYDLAPSGIYRLNKAHSVSEDSERGHGGTRAYSISKQPLALKIQGTPMLHTRIAPEERLFSQSHTYYLDQIDARILLMLGLQFGLNSATIKDTLLDIYTHIPMAKQAVREDRSSSLDRSVKEFKESGYLSGRIKNNSLREDFCNRIDRKARQLFTGLDKEFVVSGWGRS